MGILAVGYAVSDWLAGNRRRATAVVAAMYPSDREAVVRRLLELSPGDPEVAALRGGGDGEEVTR